MPPAHPPVSSLLAHRERPHRSSSSSSFHQHSGDSSHQQQQIPEPPLKMPMKLAYWDIRGVRRTVLFDVSFSACAASEKKVIPEQSDDASLRLLHALQTDFKLCRINVCISTSYPFLLPLRNTDVHVLEPCCWH